MTRAGKTMTTRWTGRSIFRRIGQTVRSGPARRAMLAAILLAGVAGCNPYNPSDINAFLQQTRHPVSGTEYRVLPPDVLQINSRHVPEINMTVQLVRPDGMINIPLIGEVQVAGRTPTEIEAEITSRAEEFYGQADCTVQVLAYNSQKYFVFGQVLRPGPMPWTGHDTLLDALATAQPNILSWPERIVLVRGGSPQYGGQARSPSPEFRRDGIHPDDRHYPAQKVTINLWAMVRSGDMAANVMLLPNDTIYVPPNPFARVGLALQNILLPIRPAVETMESPARVGTAWGNVAN